MPPIRWIVILVTNPGGGSGKYTGTFTVSPAVLSITIKSGKHRYTVHTTVHA